MKKKFLALLLGGVMTAGALFMQMPATAQAAEMDCDGYSSSHIKSSQVTTVNGKLTVTIDIEFEVPNGSFDLYVFDKQLEKKSDPMDYPEDYYQTWFGKDAVEKLVSLKEGGTYTFENLTDGKPYYVYCNVDDNHAINEWGESGDPDDVYRHVPAAYLGSVNLSSSVGSGSSSAVSGSSSTGSVGSCNVAEEESYELYLDNLTNEIEAAPSGSTVVVEKGITTLSNSTMKELLAKGDVSLKMEFTYQDKKYVIIIPAGAALDNDIPWYGPLYLAQHFGNRAGTTASGTGNTYEVQSGDCMSKIAAVNHMTLKQLLERNPQITDPNKITVNQKINL